MDGQQQVVLYMMMLNYLASRWKVDQLAGKVQRLKDHWHDFFDTPLPTWEPFLVDLYVALLVCKSYITDPDDYPNTTSLRYARAKVDEYLKQNPAAVIA